MKLSKLVIISLLMTVQVFLHAAHGSGIMDPVDDAIQRGNEELIMTLIERGVGSGVRPAHGVASPGYPNLDNNQMVNFGAALYSLGNLPLLNLPNNQIVKDVDSPSPHATTLQVYFQTPDQAAVDFAIANFNFDDGDYKVARFHYQRVLNNSASSREQRAQANMKLGDIYFADQDLVKARTYYTSVIDDNLDLEPESAFQNQFLEVAVNKIGQIDDLLLSQIEEWHEEDNLNPAANAEHHEV
jgi:tetratricopeptide (TPR) repeat protein